MTHQPSDLEVKPLNSVEKALEIMRVTTTAEEPYTLSQIARKVNLPVTTVARHLKTLEQAEFLVRDDYGSYLPGRVLIQLGAQAVGRHSLYELAESYLKSISEYTGETAYLGISAGHHQAVYLRQVESVRAIRHATWVGKTINTQGTAIGAALENQVGPQGFVCSRATRVEPEAAAVAVPILSNQGEVIAALSVIGPSYRLSEEKLQAFGRFMRQQVVQLSKQMM